MKQEIKIGQQDYTVLVFIPDPASTDGSGKTGLNAAALTVSYTRVETDNDVVVTDATGALSDLANLTAAHADWGVYEVSSTLAPGLYRLDIADAVFLTGAWSAVVYVMITASAAAASPMEFALVPEAPYSRVTQTGDAYAIVSHTDYGNAKLVRSTTPANTLTVDASHRALSDLASILGTALTETAGQIAAAFKKFFNVAIPVATAESVNQTADNEGKVAIAYQVWQEALASHLDAGFAARARDGICAAACAGTTKRASCGRAAQAAQASGLMPTYDERDAQPYPQASQVREAADALADAESAWVLLIEKGYDDGLQ